MSNRNRKLHPQLWQPTYLLNRAIAISLRKIVERFIPVGTIGELLDVGCGSMPYRELFVPLVRSYVGCDMYPTSEGVVACPADELAFEDNHFDAIVCFQVLEHVPQPWRVLEECARVLKPGGFAIVTVPFLFPYHAAPRDYFRYTPDGIVALAERVGLEVKQMEPQVSTLPTIVMILNIKFMEMFGYARRVTGLRYFVDALQTIVFCVTNPVGLFFGLFARNNSRILFPGYANYLFVLDKPNNNIDGKI